MPTLIELLEPEIEATIGRLRDKEFNPDPISGPKFSRIVSVAGSAYKRHGNILEKAIVEHLSAQPGFDVWTESQFQVPPNADLIATNILNDPSSIAGNELSYGPGGRTLQIDAMVYNNTERTLRAYEIKRGFGSHDSQKKKSMLRNALCVQLLLRSYAQTKGLSPASVGSHVIFYYGNLSVAPPIGIKGDELDAHFGVPCVDAIETVNTHFGDRFRATLYEMITQ